MTKYYELLSKRQADGFPPFFRNRMIFIETE
jgi:hypothetical protein